MERYYLEFNPLTQQVDVFNKVSNCYVHSVKVIDGIVSFFDVYQIAIALNISERRQIAELASEAERIASGVN